jgi:Recombination endonuclease VII
MKRCGKCGETKPLSEFPARRSSCKVCFGEYQRSYARKRAYGLTVDDVAGMLAAQRGRCAICRVQIALENLDIDHDHATGKVRGLLCGRCNPAIGMLKDDPKVIRSAIRYLTHRQETADALFLPIRRRSRCNSSG